MATGRTVVLASANPKKAAEIADILGDKIDLVPRPPEKVPEVVQDADTFVGNARLKAEALVGATGLAALADDSGLESTALDGRPAALRPLRRRRGRRPGTRQAAPRAGRSPGSAVAPPGSGRGDPPPSLRWGDRGRRHGRVTIAVPRVVRAGSGPTRCSCRPTATAGPREMDPAESTASAPRPRLSRAGGAPRRLSDRPVRSDRSDGDRAVATRVAQRVGRWGNARWSARRGEHLRSVWQRPQCSCL